MKITKFILLLSLFFLVSNGASAGVENKYFKHVQYYAGGDSWFTTTSFSYLSTCNYENMLPEVASNSECYVYRTNVGVPPVDYLPLKGVKKMYAGIYKSGSPTIPYANWYFWDVVAKYWDHTVDIERSTYDSPHMVYYGYEDNELNDYHGVNYRTRDTPMLGVVYKVQDSGRKYGRVFVSNPLR